MKENNQKTSTIHQDNEVDLIKIAIKILDKRKFIFKIVFIFFIIGVVVALVTPKSYTASTTFILDSAKESFSSRYDLSNLAMMANIDFDFAGGGGGESMNPNVYSKIIRSLPFKLDIMNTSYNIASMNSSLTLYTFYTKHKKGNLLSVIKKYTIGLPSLIFNKNDKKEVYKESEDIMRLSKEEFRVLNIIENALSFNIDDAVGVITLSATANDASLAAQIAKNAYFLLQKKVTALKIKKEKEKLNFINRRFEESIRKFESIQSERAQFRDQNKNITSEVAKICMEKLENEYNIAFAIQTTLATELENSYIRIKDDTPIFSIIDPVYIPLKRTKPKRKLIVAIYILLGFLFGIAIVLVKDYIKHVKNRIQSD